MRVDKFGIYHSKFYEKESVRNPTIREGTLTNEALLNGRASDTMGMIVTVSMQDLRNTYDDLKKRVEQLGRFL